MVYSEFDDGQFTSFHRRLLGVKGSNDQVEFLNVVKDSDLFIEYIDSRIESSGRDPVEPFPGPLTEFSFKDMTHDQEHTAYETWAELPPRIACRVSFWGKTTLEHVRNGKIPDSSWLAMNGGTRHESGEERIDFALASSGDGRNLAIDNCVRTVFRRMSGLPLARGNRSVYVDSTFGRAWWRARIVDRVAARSGVESKEDILAVVRLSQAYWEKLVTMIVSRGSVFGSIDIQDALINSLAKRLSENGDSRLKVSGVLDTAMRRISNIAAAREISVLTFEEVGAIIDEVLLNVETTAT